MPPQGTAANVAHWGQAISERINRHGDKEMARNENAKRFE
jgi:hypothetical protein